MASMSATDAIRQVAKNLKQAQDLYDNLELDERLDDAVMMLIYIADALDHEFKLAAQRGREQQETRRLLSGGLDTWDF